MALRRKEEEMSPTPRERADADRVFARLFSNEKAAAHYDELGKQFAEEEASKASQRTRTNQAMNGLFRGRATSNDD
jgi:hypothetical protein